MGTFVDLVGQTFGRLTVLARVENAGEGTARFRCRCACGRERVVRSYCLRSGETRSCGCYAIEVSTRRIERVTRRHGESGRGHRSPEWNAWSGAKGRCFNRRYKSWKDYGGRGITMCDRWRDSFETFLADMGRRPPGLTLDRIDNDGNYEPGNCRWATPREQRANQRPRPEVTHGF